MSALAQQLASSRALAFGQQTVRVLVPEPGRAVARPSWPTADRLPMPAEVSSN